MPPFAAAAAAAAAAASRLASVTAALHLAAARPSDGAGASLTGASPPPPPFSRRSARGRRLPCQSRRLPCHPAARTTAATASRLAAAATDRPLPYAALSAVQGASPRGAASPQCTALSAPLTISEEVVLHSMELGERLASPSARVKCSRASMCLPQAGQIGRAWRESRMGREGGVEDWLVNSLSVSRLESKRDRGKKGGRGVSF